MLRFVGRTEKKINKSKPPNYLFLMASGTYMQNFNPLAQLELFFSSPQTIKKFALKERKKRKRRRINEIKKLFTGRFEPKTSQ